MKGNRNRRFLERGQFRLYPLSLLFELGDALPSVVLRNDVSDDKIDVALPLALDPIALRLQARACCGGVSGKALSFTIIVAHIGLDQPRILQFFGHAAEDQIFDVAKVQDSAVRTAAAFAHGRAADAGLARFVPVMHRQAGSAATAAKKSGKQMWRSALDVAGETALLRLQQMSLFPNGLFDDPQMGGFDALPLVRRIGPRQPLSGVGIFDHPDLVPDDATRIQLIENEAVPALRVAVDRRCIPPRASRRTNFLAIEIPRNVARCSSVGISGEDAPNDGGLLLDDFELAGFAGDRTIAIGAPASVAAIAYHAGHTAPDFLRAILALHLSDETANPYQDGVCRAVMHRLDLDPLKGQPLVNSGEILHVAREPIQRLHDYDIECVQACSIHQLHQAIASKNRGPRPGLVLERSDD